jgi:hypothetical protein
VRALDWCLFASSAWAQSANVVAGTTVEDGVFPLFACRRGPSQQEWCRARQVRALLMPLFARSASTQPSSVVLSTNGEGGFWPLFARSACAQAASEVTNTTGEDAALATVRLVGVGSASHCGGGNVR